MDLEPSLQCDCTVSGVMSFVLHASRIVGLAPLKFKRVHGGWRISLSRFYYVYDFFVFIFIEIAAISSVSITVKGLVDGYENSANTGFMRIVTKFLQFVQGIVGLTIVYTGYNRCHHTINSITRLEQINKEFDRLCRPQPTSETKLWCLVIFTIFYGSVGTLSEYTFYLYDVISLNKTVPLKSITFAAVHVYQVCLNFIPVQFLVVVMRLLSTQERLNNSLKGLLQEITNKPSLLTRPIPKCVIINKKRPNMPHLISNINRRTSLIGKQPQIENSHGFRVSLRNESWMPNMNIGIQRNGLKAEPEILVQLTNIYCSLCDVLRQLDASNGLPLIMLLMHIIANLVTMPYFVVAPLRQVQVKLPIVKALSILAWNSVCFLMLIMVTEPCHRAHDQVFIAVILFGILWYISQIEGILKKGHNWRACMKTIMKVEEARDVCQDRSKWKTVVSAYPTGKELYLTKDLITQMMRYTPKKDIAVNYELKMFQRHILLNPVTFHPLRLVTLDRYLVVKVVTTIVTYLSVVLNL